MRTSLFVILLLVFVVDDSIQVPEPNPFIEQVVQAIAGILGGFQRKPKEPKEEAEEEEEPQPETEKPEPKPKPKAKEGEKPKEKEPPVPVPEKQVETEIVSACDQKSGELAEKIIQLREKIDEMEAAKSSPVFDYSRGDEYLTRWLIRCKMEVNDCKTMIEKHLTWRKQLNVDKVDQENWKEIYPKYPIFTDTFDRAKRPILEWWLDSWDINAMTKKGPIGIKVLLLWFVKSLETITKQMYELNVKTKRCTTQAVALVDMEDIEDAMHTCPTCLQLLQLMGNTYETHYPNLFNKLHFVNVDDPAAAKVMQSFVSGFTQKDRILSSIKYYENREKWEGPLNEIIDPSERGEQFGGTKQRQMQS